MIEPRSGFSADLFCKSYHSQLLVTDKLIPFFLQFLIDILSFTAFSMDSSSPSGRLSVTLTLLLTAVAFKIVLAQSLPTISYLTLLVRQCFVICSL